VTIEKLAAETPLNFTAVALFKYCPVTVTVVPTAPLEGVKPETVGAIAVVVTVKLFVLVAVPTGVVTEMGPVVAPCGTGTVR
jgi:hypothetical protein